LGSVIDDRSHGGDLGERPALFVEIVDDPRPGGAQVGGRSGVAIRSLEVLRYPDRALGLTGG
jgi:hypothetical protein